MKGDYVEKYQICFISVTLKSWSARKLLDPITYFSIKMNADIISGLRNMKWK